jgi:23S rRNA (uracil1939-C5)-methyltransferase
MEIEIVRLDNQGRGIGFYNDKIIFIPNSLPGELVLVEIIKEKTKYIEARLIEILRESPKRIKAPCKYYGLCGGCQIMHMAYSDQLEYKKDKVKQLFKRQLELELNIEIEHSNPFNYRNKVSLHDGGFYDIYNEKIIKIKECLIAREEINKKLKKGIKGDVILKVFGDEENSYEQLNNIRYRISFNSFFQINKEIAIKMFDYIKEKVDKENKILDLYSGSGSIGLYISDKVNKVLGIDINQDAIDDANFNVELNKINNANYICDDANNYLKDIDEHFDLIIVDPPRAGLDKIGINLIQELDPQKIIYVSCDPMTLIRDLKELNNYKVLEVRLFDMFPNTYHVETVVTLVK